MTGTSSANEPTQSWHVDDDALSRYAAGRVSAAVAASTEAHLTTCAACRTRLAPAVPAPRLDAIWDEVEQRVDTLTLPWFERALVRLGMGEDTARLLAATPSLTMPWLVSVAASAFFAAVAADVSSRGLFAFLTLAPMLPVAGVAAAYGRDADPAHEIAVASPYSMLRLLLLRSVTVVATTIVLTGLAGLLLADRGWAAAGWLLPAAALTAATLLLSARLSPVWAAAAVLGTWVVGVGIAWQSTGSRLAAFGEVGQGVAVAVTLICLGLLVAQRHTFAFDTRRTA
jgi:hypothetical protein